MPKIDRHIMYYAPCQETVVLKSIIICYSSLHKHFPLCKFLQILYPDQTTKDMFIIALIHKNFNIQYIVYIIYQNVWFFLAHLLSALGIVLILIHVLLLKKT